MEGNSKATATNFKLSLQLKHMLQKTPEGKGNRANLFLFTEKMYLKHVTPGLKDAVKTLLWNVYSVSQVVFCGICTWLIKTDCKSSPYLLHERPEETEDIWLLKKKSSWELTTVRQNTFGQRDGWYFHLSAILSFPEFTSACSTEKGCLLQGHV